jgi:dTDP-4-amino-4,6-dideoxygalactose transaminase
VASAHLSDGGPFAGRCIRLLEELLPGSRVLLTTSCTTALEMTATLLEVGPGDEVIVPSFAFVSTANAFACGVRGRSSPRCGRTR